MREKVATEEGAAADLFFRLRLGQQGVRMEDKVVLAGLKMGQAPETAGQVSCVLHAGELLSQTSSPLVKEDQDGGGIQCWELQDQETGQPLHSRWGKSWPTEFERWDDMPALLASFEHVAYACQWPREELVARLLPALSGDAREAYLGLGPIDRQDYGKVKAAILKKEAMALEKQRQHFRQFQYQEATGPQDACRQVRVLCHCWLKPESRTKEQILELLILEQFLTILPEEIQSRVRERAPETCIQAVTLVENLLEMQQGAARQELQVTAVNSPKAELASSDTGQRLRCREAVQTVGGDVSSLGSSDSEATWDSSADEQGSGGSGRQGAAAGAGHERTPIKTEEHVQQEEYAERHMGTEGLQTHPGTAGRDSAYLCAQCGKGFRWPSALAVHQRTHTGEKQHCCSECGKRFAQRGHLTVHRRIHSGEKPYACPQCGKQFVDSSHLTKHQRTHLGDRPHHCAKCGRRCANKRSLVQHERIHSKEKL